jgi:hypothetical protein
MGFGPLNSWLTRLLVSGFSQFPVTRAGSTGRCNTFQRVDSAMLRRGNHLFGRTRSNPSQSSVSSGLTLASDFSFCFQCQAGSSLVLHRPIEITRLTRHLTRPVSDSALNTVALR